MSDLAKLIRKYIYWKEKNILTVFQQLHLHFGGYILLSILSRSKEEIAREPECLACIPRPVEYLLHS